MNTLRSSPSRCSLFTLCVRTPVFLGAFVYLGLLSACGEVWEAATSRMNALQVEPLQPDQVARVRAQVFAAQAKSPPAQDVPVMSETPPGLEIRPHGEDSMVKAVPDALKSGADSRREERLHPPDEGQGGRSVPASRGEATEVSTVAGPKALPKPSTSGAAQGTPPGAPVVPAPDPAPNPERTAGAAPSAVASLPPAGGASGSAPGAVLERDTCALPLEVQQAEALERIAVTDIRWLDARRCLVRHLLRVKDERALKRVLDGSLHEPQGRHDAFLLAERGALEYRSGGDPTGWATEAERYAHRVGGEAGRRLALKVAELQARGCRRRFEAGALGHRDVSLLDKEAEFWRRVLALGEGDVAVATTARRRLDELEKLRAVQPGVVGGVP